MTWRKWLVRGLVFSVAASLAAGAIGYQRFTSPDSVRRQVVAKLGEHLVGAAVTVEAAHLRLLEGITLGEVRLTRRDDPGRTEVAYIPSAVIYHDKEQLAHGRLAIRKIVLEGPRLHVVRGADGRWNLAGIIGPFHAEALPTIEIQHGTVYVEDRLATPGMTAVEFTEVNLTLVNDPLLILNIQGTGRSALAGTVRVKGTWHRRTDATALTFAAEGVPVGPSLTRRLGAYWPEVQANAQHLSGTADVGGELGFHPELPQPWSHDVRLVLHGGALRHPRLPLPLDQLEAVVRCQDGRVRLETLTASAAGARLTAAGAALRLDPETDLDGALRVEHLALSPELFSRLPPALQKLEREYDPGGVVSVSGQFARRHGRWAWRWHVRPEDLTIAFFKFPYRLRHISGTLDQEVDPDRQVDRVDLDFAGDAGGRPVFLKGEITGDGPTSGVALRIWGKDIAIDEAVMAALPTPHQRLARTFHPTGAADVEAYINRARGSHEFSNRFIIRFHHATARYDVFPYPLEQVSGVLDIQPHHWEFSSFRGTHAGGEVYTHGRCDPGRGGDRLEVFIRGVGLRLDNELEAALGQATLDPGMKRAWAQFSPRGRMGFQARVVRVGDGPPDVEVTIHPAGCSVTPSFFPYALDELTGTVHYARRWVTLEGLRARHNGTIVSIDQGKIFLKPEGGAWADIRVLRGDPVVPDRDLLTALPPALRKLCQDLSLRDPFGLTTRLTVDAPPGEGTLPVVFWDGEMRFSGASLRAGVALEGLRGRAACRGRHNGRDLEGLVGNLQLTQASLFGQPFRDVRAEIEVPKEAPNVLALKGLHAGLFEGEVYGTVRVEFGAVPRYELYLAASQIHLEEFGRHNMGNGTQLSGLANARLHLNGQGGELDDLAGNGTVEVPNGRLGSLPLLLDLLKFLGLRLPDGTAFEEAYANFSLRGRRVAISRLDLYGNSISLRGSGEMNLDGTDVNLNFYGVWARVIQYLPPIIKDVPPLISQQLLKIQMRGRMNAVQITAEPVPGLVDPLKGFLERLAGRRKPAPSGAGSEGH